MSAADEDESGGAGRTKELLRRPAVLGTAAALITAFVGIGVVLAIASILGDDGASAARREGITTTSTRPSARRSTTTTTTTPTTRPSTAATDATAPPAPGNPAAAEEPEAPDPPDPGDAFEPGTLAPGTSVTLASCGWSPALGGQLQASGTLTYHGTEDTFWLLTVSFLVNNQGQDEELNWADDAYDLASGQTISWNLSTEEPTPPPNLSCSIAVE